MQAPAMSKFDMDAKDAVICFKHRPPYYPSFNPLPHEIYFPSIYELSPKTGSHRLRTHRRATHKNSFRLLLLIIESKFWPNVSQRTCLIKSLIGSATIHPYD